MIGKKIKLWIAETYPSAVRYKPKSFKIMNDYNIPVYLIRVQHTEVSHDTERFGFYKTKEDAEKDARKLKGYKVSVERSWSRVPFEELVSSCKTRYPNI